MNAGYFDETDDEKFDHLIRNMGVSIERGQDGRRHRGLEQRVRAEQGVEIVFPDGRRVAASSASRSAS